MNKQALAKHINSFIKESKKNTDKFKKDHEERQQLVKYYQSYTRSKILRMNQEDVYQYISNLWAMLIWGNKHYVVDKIIEENGLENFKSHLADLVWGNKDISSRWDTFRKEIRRMGPAMVSEILGKTHPDEYVIWNRRTYIGLNYLEVPNLPRYDYQVDGKLYKYLCGVAKEISSELKSSGFSDNSLLSVDYFIWDELQVVDLIEAYEKQPKSPTPKHPNESVSLHDDVRDKLRDIGEWLGLSASTEQKVADGARVDTVWEATIGNMGRVIYVFEVQTKGGMDSLMLNLLKSLNNPAVQGVVAVSDSSQLETIEKHVKGIVNLRDKLKYWDIEDVFEVHACLEIVNSSINRLDLVPKGF